MGKLLDNLRKKHADQQAKAKRHHLNFLAHKDEIAEALKEGWTSKQIWEQMVEDGMTTMSYASLCRLVKKHIMPSMNDAGDNNLSAGASPPPSNPSTKTPVNQSTKKSNTPGRKFAEKERLDLLKEEAFASVRSPKPAGPLIGKPKSRDEENEELFG